MLIATRDASFHATSYIFTGGALLAYEVGDAMIPMLVIRFFLCFSLYNYILLIWISRHDKTTYNENEK